MRIAVCDDNKDDLELIEKIVNEYKDKNDYNIDIDIYNNSETLLNRMLLFKIDKTNYDILILDVLMQTNGIDLARKIRDDGYESLIIYVSSSKEYAVDAFKVQAFDYILKPYDKKQVFLSLDNALKKLNLKPKANIIIKLNNHTTVGLDISNILYAYAKDRRIIYHMVDGKEYVTVALRKNFKETIPFDYKKYEFIFAGKNRLVNMNYIKAIDNNYFTLNDGTKIEIGINFSAEVKKEYINYLLGGEIKNGWCIKGNS